jgi:glycosyltransferase involved in cell wall biosynthesis
MTVDVVISVYSIERANDVVECIESVRKQTLPPKEIVVVLDPNYALVSYYKKLLGSTVKLVVSDTFGLSAARNTGIKSCNSEFVAFIDDDAVADKNWLKTLVNNFKTPSVIGVGGHITPIWPIKNPYWFPEELYWIIGCSYKGLPIQKSPIRNPIGCNMGFRRSIFETVGYFSVATGRVGNKLMGHDDTEFGIRATNKRPETTIVYDPQAIVYHKVAMNRVSVRYILKRSYSEGFSKAFITTFSNNNNNNNKSLGAEKSYLHTLVMGLPFMLFQNKLTTGICKFVTLAMATGLVFFGYFVGLNVIKKQKTKRFFRVNLIGET